MSRAPVLLVEDRGIAARLREPKNGLAIAVRAPGTSLTESPRLPAGRWPAAAMIGLSYALSYQAI